MSTITIEQSAVIDGRPDEVYAIFADYHQAHPAILPRPFFTNLTVTEGGNGAGTTFTAEMNVFGTHFTYHMAVTEPQPPQSGCAWINGTHDESTHHPPHLPPGIRERSSLSIGALEGSITSKWRMIWLYHPSTRIQTSDG